MFASNVSADSCTIVSVARIAYFKGNNDKRKANY